MADNKHARPDPRVIAGAYNRLFSTPDGKVVLADLEASFGGVTFNPDTNVSMYRQGQRAVVDLIKTQVEN